MSLGFPYRKASTAHPSLPLPRERIPTCGRLVLAAPRPLQLPALSVFVWPSPPCSPPLGHKRGALVVMGGARRTMTGNRWNPHTCLHLAVPQGHYSGRGCSPASLQLSCKVQRDHSLAVPAAKSAWHFPYVPSCSDARAAFNGYRESLRLRGAPLLGAPGALHVAEALPSFCTCWYVKKGATPDNAVGSTCRCPWAPYGRATTARLSLPLPTLGTLREGGGCVGSSPARSAPSLAIRPSPLRSAVRGAGALLLMGGAQRWACDWRNWPR